MAQKLQLIRKKDHITALTAKVVDALDSNSESDAPSIRAVNEALDNLLLAIYPVGSVYENVNSIDPATLFGGVWEQIENDSIYKWVRKE